MKAQSFAEFVTAYGEQFPPQMIYREGMDFEQWRRRFREALLGLRSRLPERVRAEAQVIDISKTQDHTRYTLRIPVTRISTLIAYLLVPAGLKADERRPGILALHGHLAGGIDIICGVRRMEEKDNVRRCDALWAVREGCVVIAPAWWGWEGRNAHNADAPNGDCDAIQRVAGMYGLNVLDLHVQDAQAAIDVLAGRPEVDPTRLGCIGNSHGGRMTMWMMIYDERLKACALAGCMNTFRERSQKISSCGIQYPYGLLKYGDVPELLSLIAPRPMQMQAGKRDTLITPSDRDAMVAVVRRAYELTGAEDKLDYVLEDDGHYLYWDAAGRFLKKHL